MLQIAHIFSIISFQVQELEFLSLSSITSSSIQIDSDCFDLLREGYSYLRVSIYKSEEN